MLFELSVDYGRLQKYVYVLEANVALPCVKTAHK